MQELSLIHISTGSYAVTDIDDFNGIVVFVSIFDIPVSYTHLDVYKRQVCTWNDMHRFKPSQYLIMHALVFKTEVLRESGVRLPEHTFYVDNLFAYQPLPYVKRIYYMNQSLYHYYLCLLYTSRCV